MHTAFLSDGFVLPAEQVLLIVQPTGPTDEKNCVSSRSSPTMPPIHPVNMLTVKSFHSLEKTEFQATKKNRPRFTSAMGFEKDE